ncbi:RagB/SusD family nutrient uptake outer membrane protein [Mucilaginibacter myungsuensis]|uniref:RagB/SusD family nutrient uptake outer membrane protein n=1 Tax=Mucilaginibacter myungsuensis TaxID=649104 RepID=A0A929PWF7_9SPHI|nr:RagB/SusD family nutrient uptake outer membrane protein [Mucilaginibacter myungsuensis]MBE9662031.1 RagB/SusD family nutrient uptake outer membrane protein [Mucilaginibacter myungsuensis]MDN3599536.1 RagB/SusD family nutrient uptake outer membrane protein [Mucilaginibacter myungsuensis]
MKKYYIFTLLGCLSFAACKKLDQTPQSSASKAAVFSTENGLRLYTNSFYGMGFLPRNSTTQDAMSDYLAVKSVPDFIRQGGFAANNSSGWDWSDLRNINYFIENCDDPAVPLATRKNYLGIARYFRAYFYMEKVKRFGDVPWINRPLAFDDPALIAGRDKRELVMDSVLADLDYACANIQATNDASRTTITKWVAYAYKSRVCLFEGTFRKYHTELNLTSTATKWLNETVSASDQIIKNGGYSINNAGGAGVSYRQVFTSNAPLINEVLQAAVADVNLGVLSEANWWWTSGTYGAKASFTRTFINTYLKLDGTPFTNDPNYRTTLFKDEVKGRDLRLKQTIRSGDYKRIRNGVQVPAPPVFSYTFTGYQPIKLTLDDESLDAGALNTNAIVLFRYAEVLLNYAEAKAELGIITPADWALTVGILRARGGITAGLNTLPTVADPYLRTNYFPDITDPVILEIRRERGIELSLEGFRFADILRWKRGPLMEQEWNGFYVPALNTPLDLNEDGILDVAFYQGTRPTPAVAGVTYVDVSPRVGTAVNSQLLKNGTSGELTWMNEIPRKWNDRNYYYPIPLNDIQRNPNLKPQNPGWE